MQIGPDWRRRRTKRERERERVRDVNLNCSRRAPPKSARQLPPGRPAAPRDNFRRMLINRSINRRALWPGPGGGAPAGEPGRLSRREQPPPPLIPGRWAARGEQVAASSKLAGHRRRAANYIAGPARRQGAPNNPPVTLILPRRGSLANPRAHRKSAAGLGRIGRRGRAKTKTEASRAH